jgi:ABC-type uncharacterized transport system substrate-binding protein
LQRHRRSGNIDAVRRFILFCFLSLIFLSPVAWAGSITLLLSETSGPYGEFAATLGEVLDSARWKISRVGKTDSIESSGQRPDLIISAGSEAFQRALTMGGTTPIVATLLPRQTYEKMIAQVRPQRARVTAIYLDHPPARQASFLRHLLPDLKRIGMLFSSETRPLAGQYRQSFKNAGLILDSEDSDTPNTLLPAVNALLPRVDGLLAIPDTTIYKRDNIKPILVTSYRHQRPVIAFSAPFVSAGALAALHTTPAQIARQTADLINSMGATLPPPAPPSQFAITLNLNVAAAFGLSIPDEAAIRRAMLAESEAR